MRWSADGDGPLTLVLIPGAGGFATRKDKLVQACEPHGEILLLDYPDLQWILQHVDLRNVADEMRTRIRERMGRRPFILAGVSLGAIVAALIIQLDLGEMHVSRVVAIDPAGSLEQVGSREGQIEPGWLARNLARARHAGLFGSPEFIWVRLNRVVAIILARWLRRNSGVTKLAAWLLVCASTRLFTQQLRMRLLIDTTTMWRRDPVRIRERVVASKVPCKVLHTSAARFDAGFWQRHFDSVGLAVIGGNHDTWYEFDGPRLLISEWDDASEQVSPKLAESYPRAAPARPS
jgi:pimeloyl-ACP methyl ester carboxylesterase